MPAPRPITWPAIAARIRRLNELREGIDIETVALAIDGKLLTAEEWGGYIGGLHRAHDGFTRAAKVLREARKRGNR